MVEVFEFVSKPCKLNNHQDCAGAWRGLGIEVNCKCSCKHKKYAEALGKVWGPQSSATAYFRSSSQEDSPSNDT